MSVDDVNYLLELVAAIRQWEIITPIEVLIELNINHNRCGVTVVEAVKLARLAHSIELTDGAIIFAGITGYEGHTPILPAEQKTQETKISHHFFTEVVKLLTEENIEVKVISAGGSCNYIDCINTSVVTEIQAGGGAFCDLLYYHKANLKDHGHRIGAYILTQIISMPSDQSRAIGNAGFKAVGWHPFGGLPEPRDYSHLKVIGLSAEHTKFEVIANESAVMNHPTLKRGDKIVLIPGYTDAMGFLHRQIYGIRNDHVESVWQTISDKTW